MKFGIREICNVVLKAKKDNATVLGKSFSKGQPVLWFDSLKTSGLEGTGEVVYARGGRGNTKLVSWEGDKEVTFTMEDALVSPMSMALLTAGSLNKSDVKYVHVSEDISFKGIENTGAPYTVGLPHLPVIDENKRIRVVVSYNNNVIKITDDRGELDGEEGAGIGSIAGDNCIFIWQGIPHVSISYHDLGITSIEGDVPGVTAKIDYYYEDSDNKITQIDIAPDSFGANFYLEAETLFRDNSAGADHAAEFIIPNCRIQSNFSFTMASTGDPSTFTFTMDVFPDYLDETSTKKVLCAIQVFEELE